MPKIGEGFGEWSEALSYGKRGLGEMRARGLTLATKLEIALEFLNKSFKNSLKGLVLYEKMTTFARLKTRQRA